MVLNIDLKKLGNLWLFVFNYWMIISFVDLSLVKYKVNFVKGVLC